MTTIAVKTLAAIDAAIEKDQGAAFRMWQGRVFPHMSDAFRPDEDDGFRSHLGASMIGENCARKLWYNFHWALKPKFPARILRLFNRGHLEEARFIAMLLMIGCQVFQQDAEGKQYRISAANGHFGGSGDGVALGIPDLPPGVYCLLEFKTHGEKSFLDLKKKGVKAAKHEHFVQMQTYMRKMGLGVALYAAVNKNTDEIHMELITLEGEVADQYIDRGQKIVYLDKAPNRISNSIGGYVCTFCDFKQVCHAGATPAKNCRTCEFSRPSAFGNHWECSLHKMDLSKELQLVGCEQYVPNKDFGK